LRPVDFKELRKLCEAEGCVFSRQRGDHYIRLSEKRKDR